MSSNLTNAYVSGMKEDLNMVGNEYNTAVSLWTVGYVIGIFSNLHHSSALPIILFRPSTLKFTADADITPSMDTVCRGEPGCPTNEPYTIANRLSVGLVYLHPRNIPHQKCPATVRYAILCRPF